MTNPNKSIRLLNLQGESVGLSNEEALAKRINRWAGWRCSAGKENIYVSPDGNIFSATCKVGGLLGNVYEDGFVLPVKWTLCAKEWCMCGQDMQLRKVKKAEYEDLLKDLPPFREVESIPAADLVLPYHYESFLRYPKFVTWDLARRCNYACEYCHESISNTYEAHKSWGSLKHAVTNIFRDFAKGDRVRWIFTGGEPTINPSYMDLVKLLHSQDGNIHTQTNGSRTAEYYSELIEYSSIGISLHLPYYQEDKFLKICQALVEKKATNENAAKYWFGIRIMVPPGWLNSALDAWDKIRAIPDFAKYGNLHMSPLYKSGKQTDQLMEYDPAEYQQIMART